MISDMSQRGGGDLVTISCKMNMFAADFDVLYPIGRRSGIKFRSRIPVFNDTCTC
jgi:hypothetical protein